MYLSDVGKWPLKKQAVYGIDWPSFSTSCRPLLLGTLQGREREGINAEESETSSLNLQTLQHLRQNAGFSQPLTQEITGAVIGLVFPHGE